MVYFVFKGLFMGSYGFHGCACLSLNIVASIFLVYDSCFGEFQDESFQKNKKIY